MARGPDQRLATRTRATASATGCCRRCAPLHPAAEANVLRTLALLRDEAAVLDAAVDAALAGPDEQVARLAALPPALRGCACSGSPTTPPAAARRRRARTAELLALGGDGGSAALDLGGGLRAVVEYGRLRFERGAAAAGPARRAALAGPRPRRASRAAS